MAKPNNLPSLPADLEVVFSTLNTNPVALIEAFMPTLCNHIKADRIFVQPRNPDTRICKVLRWRRNEDIPWPAIPGQAPSNSWFVEDKWEIEDPLWRAALQLKPSIYIEDLPSVAHTGILNLDFENAYMFHTAFIHGHAHWPPLSLSLTPPSAETETDHATAADERNFYGSVQPAVFDGPRTWSREERDLMEKCLVRIAPIMKALGETAPGVESFGEK